MAISMIPEAIQHANEVVLDAGQRVFVQGQTADNYLVVTKGCVKVFARSREGKEVILYRVNQGEMCLLTTACLLGHTKYPAEAITELETTARVIPAKDFDRLLNDSHPFRQFVFEGLSQRLAQVTQRFEHIVLESVHHRLADFLLAQADKNGMLKTTHEALALEIGTAREVVSRHLKGLEQKGLIRTERGLIVILRPNTLAKID
jgi:CRP/FNR family transcriptional regulator